MPHCSKEKYSCLKDTYKAQNTTERFMNGPAPNHFRCSGGGHGSPNCKSCGSMNRMCNTCKMAPQLTQNAQALPAAWVRSIESDFIPKKD